MFRQAGLLVLVTLCSFLAVNASLTTVIRREHTTMMRRLSLPSLPGNGAALPRFGAGTPLPQIGADSIFPRLGAGTTIPGFGAGNGALGGMFGGLVGGGGGKSAGSVQQASTPSTSGATPTMAGTSSTAAASGASSAPGTCFGYPISDITAGVARLNTLRQQFTTQHDHKPRPQVKWNDDLAALSKTVTDKCQFEHIRFPGGEGQNLATAAPHTSLVSTINYYWTEEPDFLAHGAAYEPAGHIGAFLWDEVTAVGCSITDCTNSPLKNWLSACHMNSKSNAKCYPQQDPSTCSAGGSGKKCSV